MLTKEFIYQFIRQHKLAVIATASADNKPESAVVGIAVTPALEIVFDTEKTTRKYKNITENRRVAFVIGWNDETTVQYEGEAVELNGPQDAVYRETYYAVYPDGRERAQSWPGLAQFKVLPRWLRYSNYNEPFTIEEIKF